MAQIPATARRFRRRQKPGINSAQDDDRSEQSRNGSPKGGQALADRCLVRVLQVSALPSDDHAQDDDQHESRHKARRESSRHGYIGQRGEQDRRIRRRDECFKKRRRRCQNDDEWLGISLIHHLRDHDRPDRRDGRKNRTAEGGKESHGKDHRDAQASWPMSDQRSREMDESCGSTATQHDHASKDEQRNGDQHMFGHRTERNLDQR